MAIKLTEVKDLKGIKDILNNDEIVPVDVEFKSTYLINMREVNKDTEKQQLDMWFGEDPTCNINCIISEEDGKIYTDKQNIENDLHLAIRNYGNFTFDFKGDNEDHVNSYSLISSPNVMDHVTMISNATIQELFDFIKTLVNTSELNELIVNFGMINDNRYFIGIPLEDLKINSEYEEVKRVEEELQIIIDKCKYYMLLNEKYPFKFEELSEEDQFLIDSLKLKGNQSLEKYMVGYKGDLVHKLI